MVRDGADIETVAIGQDLQIFDLVKTGVDGQAELAITSPQLPAHDHQDEPRHAVLPGGGAVDGKQESTVGIMGGQIALKVAKLLSNQSVQVRSDSAVMGVRGTDFTVTAPESGDVLVTCDEGEVVVTDDQGKDLTAMPGTVVEQQPGTVYRTVPVAATGLETFRTSWRGERSRVRAGQRAASSSRPTPACIASSARSSTTAHQELARNQQIMRKWAFEDRAGRIGSAAELARERRTIGALIARLRRTAFRLERVAFRLERLQALHDRGVGQGTLDGGDNDEGVLCADRARARRRGKEARPDTLGDKAVPEEKRRTAAVEHRAQRGRGRAARQPAQAVWACGTAVEKERAARARGQPFVPEGPGGRA